MQVIAYFGHRAEHRIEHELKTIIKLHFNGVGLGNAGIACWKTFKLYVT